MPQRNVTITSQQDEFVKSTLVSGRFGNISEVFRAGLRLLEREEQEMQLFHRELDKGLMAFQQGDYTQIRSPDELEAFFEELGEGERAGQKGNGSSWP
uniref:Antitoxin ParD n=1 Tax=Candidatus Kentrum sp. FM TaxID=2126340 RepID=A0A450VLW1_9GAMM|nr:MAG: putative addiction module antidote protein, CC2985 family [Candidatus Kentron sp. FM]VFJ43849.1 MAG: putative addiction module antidote protein, CC2985 family [Candidatus Kentron sp. FM]VFK05775.1 MAG: putative addiction module antidote protein, CC2985 family [Candidatus Kentron sp. FM]